MPIRQTMCQNTSCGEKQNEFTNIIKNGQIKRKCYNNTDKSYPELFYEKKKFRLRSCTKQNGHILDANQNETSDKQIHTSKHVKLKSNTDQNKKLIINEKNDSTSKLHFVLESAKRLRLLRNVSSFDQQKNSLNSDIHNLLTKDTEIELCISLINRNSEYLSNGESSTQLSGRIFTCKWISCTKIFSTVDKLIEHVKCNHITPARESGVYVCQWMDCKFLNQPSSSYKYLTNHVLRHCNVKPFPCVIHGCDMSFSTQSGLARHVPGHFKNGKVRRTCVMSQQQHQKTIEESKRNLNKSFEFKDKSQKIHGKLPPVEYAHTQKDDISLHILKKIKQQIQQATCSSNQLCGYSRKHIKLHHKIIGKRTTSDGSIESLVTTFPNNLIASESFWVKERKEDVLIPVSDLIHDHQNSLYRANLLTSSKRRKGRRK